MVKLIFVGMGSGQIDFGSANDGDYDFRHALFARTIDGRSNTN